jgi:hypothetical protein
MEPSNEPGVYTIPAYVEAPQETDDHSLMIYRGFEMDPDPGIAPGGCFPQYPEPHLPVEWLPTPPTPPFVEAPHLPWDMPVDSGPFPCMPVE